MIFLVSDHIEVSGTGEAEDNVLRFAGLFAFEALFFGIIGLRNGGIELVTAACVVALELVVDMRGSPEFLLEAVRAYER